MIKKTEKRKPTLIEALIPVICLVIFIGYSVFVLKASPHIPLICGAIVTVILAVTRLGYSWDEMEKGILKAIDTSMQASLTFLTVGIIIGTWILCGSVPAMIYYGLKILSPNIFLVATCVICAIVSLATGSSWTTVGTVGIALLIPPILVIVMVIFKIPAIPGLIFGSLLGSMFAAIFQGASIGDIINAAHYGYVSEIRI